jgi:hypothetical protein
VKHLAVIAALLVGTAACAELPQEFLQPGTAPDGSSDGGGGSEPLIQPLDKARAQVKFQGTTDLMRFVFAPTCAAENNECHHNEDFPDLSTEGNLWNLVDLPCNLGVGERDTIEDFCEALGDELRINDNLTVRVGSVDVVNDSEGAFDHYEILLEQPLTQAFSGADFVVLRGGSQMPQLGSGNSLDGDAGSKAVRINDVSEILDPLLVAQGDENRNGVFGSGSGAIVRRGDAHQSYLMRRLLAVETDRVQMPLNENADNPTEINRLLSPDATYAVMSWINCMTPEDGVYSPIRYDCPVNTDNEGVW